MTKTIWLAVLCCSLASPVLLETSAILCAPDATEISGVTRATPMVTEEFGNKPVRGRPEWAAGVLGVANDSHRVYTQSVNGREDFVYRGDLGAVNKALARFAKIMDPKKEVLLLPGTAETKSFEKIVVSYNWKLHVPTGLCLARAKME